MSLPLSDFSWLSDLSPKKVPRTRFLYFPKYSKCQYTAPTTGLVRDTLGSRMKHWYCWNIDLNNWKVFCRLHLGTYPLVGSLGKLSTVWLLCWPPHSIWDSYQVFISVNTYMTTAMPAWYWLVAVRTQTKPSQGLSMYNDMMNRILRDKKEGWTLMLGSPWGSPLMI